MVGLFSLECWVKNLYRRGRQFRYYSELLKRTQYYSMAEITEYQNELLRSLIRHCYHHVPYYRDVMRKEKLFPESISTINDLYKIPLLDKKIVQDNFDKLISKKHYNLFCHVGKTSGSTGMPAKFVRDFKGINFEQSIVWRHWANAGDDSCKRVSLRGDQVVPAGQEKPPFWQYNFANTELKMSSYHLSLRNSKHYIAKILDFQPEILYCGPSMGHVLAKFFNYQKVRYQFNAIFTSSESLDVNVRDYIENTFNAKIYDWYGQAERVAAIAQCRYGNYHIQEDYSIVELLPSDAPFKYDVIGTSLYNHVMPLLRYHTQDSLSMRDDLSHISCPCGSHFRMVQQIFGRSYGYLYTPEGYHIAITAHIPVGVENVIETQFYQEQQGEVTLRVLTNGRFNEADKERLVLNTLRHTSPDMRVHVEEVDEIPRGPNGKFINIINHSSSLV